MKLRWKFLCFLGVFLTGSFMIVTWKSFSIFSQKYAKTLQIMELQSLEQQSQQLSRQFDVLRTILLDNEKIQTHLRTLNISLLAHVVNDGGKWKAQWYEGQPGARRDAAGLAKQVPFESLSSSKRSWHLVQGPDRAMNYAYVIPTLANNQAGFYVFFLPQTFLAKFFKGQSQLESLTLFSPHIGEIFTHGEGAEAVEKNKASLRDSQNGVIGLGGDRIMAYHFNPNLQLYFVKTKVLSQLRVESATYLAVLFGLIAFLVAACLLAMDLLLKNIFGRVEMVTAELRMRSPENTFGSNFDDELQELEYLARGLETHMGAAPVKTVEKVSQRITDEKPAAKPEVPVDVQELLQKIRPRAINSLGYLNRIKSQVTDSAHLNLLEKELRELRQIIDPIPGISTGGAPQPYFNPILENFKKDAAIEEPKPTTQAAGSPLSIRKPKRESNEPRNI